ncbi:hypothetical protein VSDG_07455 [Cytospora chrysosperma]|uniref:DUF952 domain-containing protein n=1 Tax=Cytospora chrysosperma TaxID=252740 RepID=A0A423VI22_CYTCH|nr:hypothetical protein VSDG_07455 [Valsa sordida]
MPAPKSLPTYVYKIVDSAPPSPLPDVYPLSELDKHDGFVHLSTSWQVPITADLFFASHTTLHLIKIRLAPRLSQVKWDDPPDENDGCPHLYGSFGAADVESVETFEKASGGGGGGGGGQSWKEVFASSGWLE